MKHKEFVIREKFYCGGKQWLCTDIGTRTIIAVEGKYNNGPPYAVAEIVFDEYDIEGCTKEGS